MNRVSEIFNEYRLHQEKIEIPLEQIKKELYPYKNKIVLYGAGSAGIAFLHYLIDAEIFPCYFSDGDREKHGEYLAHGGRIGKVSSVAGSLLGIKPVITLKQGEIFPSGIGRSRRKNLDKTISLLQAYLAESGEDVSRFSIAVGYGYDYQEAVEYRRLVSQALGGRLKEEDILLLQIGATISVHTGPYPLGLGIIRKAV